MTENVAPAPAQPRRLRAARPNFGVVALGALATLLCAGLIGVAVWRSFSEEAIAPTPTIPALEPNLAFVSDQQGVGEFELPGQPATPMRIGSEVEVGPDAVVRQLGEGRLRFGLANNTVLFLDSNTEIKLIQIASPSTGTNETRLQVNFGQILVSAVLPPGQTFSAIAETGAQAQIAGTLMGVEYDPGAQRFDVDCLTGRCRLIGTTGEILQLVAGEHSFVIGEGPPSPVDPARYELYGDLADSNTLPTLTPTPRDTIAPSSTPNPERTPTRTWTSTPTTAVSTVSPTGTDTPLPISATPTSSPLPAVTGTPTSGLASETPTPPLSGTETATPALPTSSPTP